MLIHKKTLGVLEYLWDECGDTMQEASFQTAKQFPEITPEAWWFLPNGSSLAARILQCYPEFTPIMDETGRLKDIYDLRRAQQSQRLRSERKKRIEKEKKQARSRGFERVYRTKIQPGSAMYMRRALRKRMDGQA